MNNVTLLQGDCLELMHTIPDCSVDMVMCDLPYGTTACKWDSIIPFEPLWAAYSRICKPNAAIVLTANQPFASCLIQSNLKKFRHEWLWKKDKPGNFAAAKFQPLRNYENVLVFSEERLDYKPQMVKRDTPIKRGNASERGKLKNQSSSVCISSTAKIYNERFPTAIIEDIGTVRKTVHPTQKPVALMEYLIKTYTNEGETVLDNTMGSGTTGVACGSIGRRFIGIERDENYFKIAEKRVMDSFNGKLGLVC